MNILKAIEVLKLKLYQCLWFKNRQRAINCTKHIFICDRNLSIFVKQNPLDCH